MSRYDIVAPHTQRHSGGGPMLVARLIQNELVATVALRRLRLHHGRILLRHPPKGFIWFRVIGEFPPSDNFYLTEPLLLVFAHGDI